MKNLLEKQIFNLRDELRKKQKDCLHATRAGDFMRVARLTTEISRINKDIFDKETRLLELV